MASIKHEEYIYNGRRVVLDAAEIHPGIYDTMIYRASDGDEIDSETLHSEAAALAVFDTFRKVYPPDVAKLTGKYAQLRDDLRKALSAGVAAEAADPEDGGTCNFDSAALYLPRWNARSRNAEAVTAALKAMGYEAIDYCQMD